MQPLEFLMLLLDNITVFGVINILCFITLYYFVKGRVLAGVLDPLFLILVIGFSTKYSIVIFLYLNDLITLRLFLMVFVYALILLFSYAVFTRVKHNSFLTRIISQYNNGKYEYIICLSIYFFISLFVLYNIGFGIFAETNRFENSRGFGGFVRVLDLLSVFIIAFSAVKISELQDKGNTIIFSILLFSFILFSALINGAKISVLFGFMAVFFALKLHYPTFNLSVKKMILGISFGVAFMFIGLSINMTNNGEDINSSSQKIAGTSLVAEKFINRMVSNGNTAYLILPYDIIDKLETDGFLTRILTPVIGITQMSKLVGYNAGDYSVGRQALLYHHEGATVAGGPTSHFDFFSYVNLGIIGGGVFVAFIGMVLGSLQYVIQAYSRGHQKNSFLTAIYTTFWFRCVIVIVEPSVGFAYLFDAFLILSVISIFAFILKKQ